MANQYLCLVLLSTIVSVSIVASMPKYPSLSDQRDRDSDQSDQPDQPSTSSILCQPCPAGWGVKSQCNVTSNTVCTPCPSGYWSPKRPHFRPCSPCSKCGDGLYEDVPCTSTRDTVCDSCLNLKGHFNEDYKKKCDWRRVPESMKPADDDRVADDDDDDEDYEDGKPGVPMIQLISERLKKWRLNLRADEEGLKIDDPKIDHDLIAAIDDEEDDDQATDQDIDQQPKVGKSIFSPAEIDQDDDQDTDQDLGKPVDDQASDKFLAAYVRLMALRRKAQVTMDKLSQRVENESSLEETSGDVDEDDDDEKDKEDKDQPPVPARIPVAHIKRPFPQRTPAAKVVVSPLMSSDEWEEDPSSNNGEKRLEVNYPPSYHSYPIDSLIHNQRHRAIVILGLTCAMVLSAVVSILLFVRSYRKRVAYNRVAVVNLSPEEREIVRQSATQLASIDKPVKKYHLGRGSGYTTLVNADSTTSLAIRENPLEAYLNGEDVSRHEATTTPVEQGVQNGLKS